MPNRCAEGVRICIPWSSSVDCVEFVYHLGKLRTVGHLDLICYDLISNKTIVGNNGISLALAPLGCDEYHAVGCPYAVDSLRRCIFQNADVADVSRIQEADVVIPNAIHNIERVRISI